MLITTIQIVSPDREGYFVIISVTTTRRIFILSIERTGERPLYIKEEKRGQSSQQEFSIIEISEQFTSEVQFFIQGPFCNKGIKQSHRYLRTEFLMQSLSEAA